MAKPTKAELIQQYQQAEKVVSALENARNLLNRSQKDQQLATSGAYDGTLPYEVCQALDPRIQSDEKSLKKAMKKLNSALKKAQKDKVKAEKQAQKQGIDLNATPVPPATAASASASAPQVTTRQVYQNAEAQKLSAAVRAVKSSGRVDQSVQEFRDFQRRVEANKQARKEAEEARRQNDHNKRVVASFALAKIGRRKPGLFSFKKKQQSKGKSFIQHAIKLAVNDYIKIPKAGDRHVKIDANVIKHIFPELESLVEGKPELAQLFQDNIREAFADQLAKGKNNFSSSDMQRIVSKAAEQTKVDIDYLKAEKPEAMTESQSTQYKQDMDDCISKLTTRAPTPTPGGG